MLSYSRKGQTITSQSLKPSATPEAMSPIKGRITPSSSEGTSTHPSNELVIWRITPRRLQYDNPITSSATLHHSRRTLRGSYVRSDELVCLVALAGAGPRRDSHLGSGTGRRSAITLPIPLVHPMTRAVFLQETCPVAVNSVSFLLCKSFIENGTRESRSMSSESDAKK